MDDVKLMTFKLAAGRIESSPFRPEAMQRLREELSFLTVQPKKETPPGQSFADRQLSWSKIELSRMD